MVSFYSISQNKRQCNIKKKKKKKKKKIKIYSS